MTSSPYRARVRIPARRRPRISSPTTRTSSPAMAANPSAPASARTCRTPAGQTSRTRTNRAWAIRFPETRWYRRRVENCNAFSTFTDTTRSRQQTLGSPPWMLRKSIAGLVPACLLRDEGVVLPLGRYRCLQGAQADPLDPRQAGLGAVQRAATLGANHPRLVGAGPEFLQVLLATKDLEFVGLYRRHRHEGRALALLALAAMAHRDLVDLAVVPVFDAPAEAATLVHVSLLQIAQARASGSSAGFHTASQRWPSGSWK